MRAHAFVALVFLLALASRAYADVPPPNRCNDIGGACKNARNAEGRRYDAPGRCVDSTCTRFTLDRDGRRKGVSYPCGLCQPDPSASPPPDAAPRSPAPDAAPAPPPPAPDATPVAAAPAPAPPPAAPPPATESKGGCSVGAAPHGLLLASIGLVLAAVGLILVRRRGCGAREQGTEDAR
jgi:hypothetical protein